MGSKQNGENRGRKSVSLKIEQWKVPNINNTEKKMIDDKETEPQGPMEV